MFQEDDASDLLNLEALGIAPCTNTPDEGKRKVPPIKHPYDLEHGWKVIPKLHIGYVPLKKEKIVKPSSLNVSEASEIGEHFEKIVEEDSDEEDGNNGSQSGNESSD